MTGWRLQASSEAGFLVGGIGDVPRGVHAASGVVPDPDSGTPVAWLPGTSLKGVLRSAFRRFAEARGGPACTDAADCRCPACRVFGTPDRAGTVAIRSVLVSSRAEERQRVAIERWTRTVARTRGGLWGERRARPEGAIGLTVEIVAPLDPETLDLLDGFWHWLVATGLSVGRSKSSGSGFLRLHAVERLPERPAIIPRPPAGDGSVRPYRLRLQFLEPARLVGLRQREFFRDALDAIPSTTLRGAIGWELVRRGRPDLATDLFRSPTPVRLATAYPLAAGAASSALGQDVVPWLSLARCRGTPRHRFDLAPPRIAAELGAEPGDDVRCPACGAEVDAGELWTLPEYLVVGRTAIDARTRRVTPGMLFTEVVVPPGASFEAFLLAGAEQAEAIAALEEVHVGGRIRSGQGLARVTVEPETTASLDGRLARTRTALARHGVQGANVAVLGFLGDAAVGTPLRTILEGRGFRIIAADLRTVVRGGWSEEENRPQPIRELIRGGSWVALEVPEDSGLAELERLEREGIDDPLGTTPALLRVRDDWEVIDVPEPVPSAPTTAAETDAQIREIRELCQQQRASLPKRASLQTLLRYAQSTDSVREAILFIEYQASRREFADSRPFLLQLAQQAERRFHDDIAGLRRYLGWVVRAANVERPEDARGDGGGDRGR